MHSRWLPDHTIAALSLTHNVSDLATVASLFRTLANSPFRPYTEELLAGDAEFSWLRARLDIPWQELAAIASGAVTIAYVQWKLPAGLPAAFAPKNPPAPSWLLLADVRGAEKQADALLDAIREKLKAAGYGNRGTWVQFQELGKHNYDLPPRNFAKNDPILLTSKRIYCVYDGLLFATYDKEVAEKVLLFARRERTDSLEQSPLFQTLRQSLTTASENVVAQCFIKPAALGDKTTGDDRGLLGYVVRDGDTCVVESVSGDGRGVDAPQWTKALREAAGPGDAPTNSPEPPKFPGLFSSCAPRGLRRPTREHPVLGRMTCVRTERLHFWQSAIVWNDSWVISFEINAGPNIYSAVFDAAAEFVTWARQGESEIRAGIVTDLTHGNFWGETKEPPPPIPLREAQAYVRQLRLRRLDYSVGGSSDWRYDSLEPLGQRSGLRRSLDAQRRPEHKLNFNHQGVVTRAELCLERVPPDTTFMGSLCEQLLSTRTILGTQRTPDMQQLLQRGIADADREARRGNEQRQFFYREVRDTLIDIRDQPA